MLPQQLRQLSNIRGNAPRPVVAASGHALRKQLSLRNIVAAGRSDVEPNRVIRHVYFYPSMIICKLQPLG